MAASAAPSSSSSSRPDLRLDDEPNFIRHFRSLGPSSTDSNTTDPQSSSSSSSTTSSLSSRTIRIFDRGDYYSAHGDDADFIARTVYKTTAVIKMLGGSSGNSGLPSVTMTRTVFRGFLREVVVGLGRRVEIWENGGKSAGGGAWGWKVGRTASPGNLQAVEEEIGGGGGGGGVQAAPVILAVKISVRSEVRTVGVCFADASVRELGVSEFVDNDLYSNLESLLIQLGVRECLLASDGQRKDVELGKVRTIAENCSIAVSERPVGEFGTRDIEQDLARLLKDDKATGMLPQTDLKLAMGAAAALVKYIDVMTDPSNFGQYQLFQHDLSQFMKLDAAALRALNLMPGPRDGSKTMSLFGLLNHCKTPVGGRLLAQWLKQPLMSLEEIEKRHQLVEAFVMNTELRQTMQEEHLRSIPDLHRLAKRFQRKMANLEDVVRAYQVVIRLPGFIATLDEVIDEEYQGPLEAQYTSKLRTFSDSMGKLAEMVETTVDLDALDRHEFIIKPEFDDSLRTIRKKLDKVKADMDREHRRASQDLNQEADKKLFLENHRTHGWCFRLTRNESSCIRNKKSYLEISTQKNGVYFTTQTLQALRREHDQLSSSYNRTQSSLVSEVVAVAASYTPVLESLAAVLAHLDVIVSFAHVSVHAPSAYVRPKMHARGTGDTILKEARHPCMECQDDISFITNDVELRRDSSRFLIITGPNMGGKSTYIRTIGTIALLGQVGCFVPCTEASLSIVDCILARVGASDSQLKGVSTFMAEMLETANILKTATRDSLIIIDELGRGTSTYDGFGLAWAISEEIVRGIGAFGCFATHFHELTALADEYPNAVKNLHVVAFVGAGDAAANNITSSSSSSSAIHNNADQQQQQQEDEQKKKQNQQVTLLYRVEPGISDQSFGIHVAELVRFPEKVINMARRKAAELEDFSTALSTPTVPKSKPETGKEAGGGGVVVSPDDDDGDVTMQDTQKQAQEQSQGRLQTDSSSSSTYSRQDMEEGTALLKEMLIKWRKQTTTTTTSTTSSTTEANAAAAGSGSSTKMTTSAKLQAMKDLVRADERLMKNRFFNESVISAL